MSLSLTWHFQRIVFVLSRKYQFFSGVLMLIPSNISHSNHDCWNYENCQNIAESWELSNNILKQIYIKNHVRLFLYKCKHSLCWILNQFWFIFSSVKYLKIAFFQKEMSWDICFKVVSSDAHFCSAAETFLIIMFCNCFSFKVIFFGTE